MTKSTRFLGLWLLVGLTMASCSSLNNSASESTTNTPAPETAPKDGDRPKGLADKEENKTLAPPETANAPVTDEGDAAAEDIVPVPTTAPPAVRAVPQNVPRVAPIRTEGAIAANYETPDISRTIAPYLVANKTNIGACRDIVFDPDLAATASNAHRVGENRYLVQFICGSSAYQPLQEYYLYERTTDVPVITPLSLTYFYTDLDGNLIEETERTMAGYGEYVSDTQTVSIFTKGRGLGDCGTLGFYRLDGSQLVLERFLAKDECDGNYLEPIDYPQLYP